MPRPVSRDLERSRRRRAPACAARSATVPPLGVASIALDDQVDQRLLEPAAVAVRPAPRRLRASARRRPGRRGPRARRARRARVALRSSVSGRRSSSGRENDRYSCEDGLHPRDLGGDHREPLLGALALGRARDELAQALDRCERVLELVGDLGADRLQAGGAGPRRRRAAPRAGTSSSGRPCSRRASSCRPWCGAGTGSRSGRCRARPRSARRRPAAGRPPPSGSRPIATISSALANAIQRATACGPKNSSEITDGRSRFGHRRRAQPAGQPDDQRHHGLRRQVDADEHAVERQGVARLTGSTRSASARTSRTRPPRPSRARSDSRRRGRSAAGRAGPRRRRGGATAPWCGRPR